MYQQRVLALDIGSNSVGSVWIDRHTGAMTTGTSIFPAGVAEADDKRGEPKNATRRMTRRPRITLRRRAARKRELRLRLIAAGLLPGTAEEFRLLLESTDPWALRRRGLDHALTPHEFGRVLLHLAQRRGALGIKMASADDGDEPDASEDGKVKASIGEVRAKMLAAKVRTFGEYIASERDRRRTPLSDAGMRPEGPHGGPREFRGAVRNKKGGAHGGYEHCADRAMIRDEFAKLWDAQRRLGGASAALLTEALRQELDNERGNAVWKHKGLLFGQRRQTWDLGALGRCVLEPTERCAPHADMHASRYRVVETVNNLKVIEHGRPPRPLTPDERTRIKAFLAGPLGTHTKGKAKGKPKSTVNVTDLREFMGWGKATKASRVRFNIEADEDREINTDWFSRAIVHGGIGPDVWAAMPARLKDGINHAILKFDPLQDGDEAKLRAGLMTWGGLSRVQADGVIAGWRTRPKPDAKRLTMSRKAVRNLLAVMDRAEPWPDANSTTRYRWLTQIEARQLLAGDGDFHDQTTGLALDEHARRRYATGAKGATAADRYYMAKHVLMKDGKPIIGPDGRPLAEPPPAPMISNPVVRKAIHEVRRHLVEYMTTFGRRPDEVRIELAREARMGAKDADRLLFKNRLRSRIRNDIIDAFSLHGRTASQQRAAIDRVVLCVQQRGTCPLCGQPGLPARGAAAGEGCEIAHILPRASGGDNGYRNIVLAHTKCNRDMARRTPRQYWADTCPGGYDEGYSRVKAIYTDIERPALKQTKSLSGDALWLTYFDRREDARKLEQFSKDIADIKDMTLRQDAATKYAARQVMAYIADAVFDGKGLPERSPGASAEDRERQRRIFSSDGLWTSRLRREWGLFFDPHKGLSNAEEHERKEKNRGDHRHHAIDAIVIGYCTAAVQRLWEAREQAAEIAGVNSADGEQMEAYARSHPIPPPSPYWDWSGGSADAATRFVHATENDRKDARDRFRNAVKAAVYGDDQTPRPICHRPVKRNLIGALHEETLFGPGLDGQGQPTGKYTSKKGVLDLTPNHLRMPEGWDDLGASLPPLTGDKHADNLARNPTLRRLAAMEDPPPGKSGIVRDRALRNQLRRCLRSAGLDPDDFTAGELKKAVDAGKIRHASGVPIRSVVLLRTMSDPVIIDRKAPDYATGAMRPDPDPASRRAYVGGNNHHIEIREKKDKKGNVLWTGVIVSAFEAAERKLAKLRAFKAAGVPKPADLRALPRKQRAAWRPIIAEIERTHPIVDRRDDDALGGRFVMSLCEGEMVSMLDKRTREPGYFVVAKLDKPSTVVLVPHWDARPAGQRKDADGKKIPNSEREQFSANPSDLAELAAPGHRHAAKIRVSPLGVLTVLDRD